MLEKPIGDQLTEQATAATDVPTVASPTTGEQPKPHVVIITGLSGAGKTATSKLLEDQGFTVVDNLPAELLRELAELVVRDPARFERLALVLDARVGDVPLAFAAAVGALEGR